MLLSHKPVKRPRSPVTVKLNKLAFTRPKAGREVGTGLRGTKAFDMVPHRRLRATPPRAIGPFRCRTTGQRLGELANSDRRPLRRLALVARADFLKMGHFAPFSQFLDIKGRNFRMFFIRSRLPMTPMNHEKFHVNWSARFEKSGRQTHRQTDAATLHIYIYRLTTCWLLSLTSSAMAGSI